MIELTRRQLLAITGGFGLLSGCSGSSGEAASTPTQTPTSTSTPTPTETPTPTPTPTPTQTQTQTQTPIEAPDYEVPESKDLSTGTAIRVRFDVVPEKEVKELSREEFISISRHLVRRATSEYEVNAITIFFWPGPFVIGQVQAYANVDWAPYGEWDRAGEVETGDYSTHEYKLIMLAGEL